MKFILIVVASMCLAQNSAHGHALVRRATNPVQEAANNAIAQVSALAARVSTAVVEANKLLHEYSDNSTDYVLRIDFFDEINTTIIMINRAFDNATITAASSNGSIIPCLAAERNRTLGVAIGLIEKILKCGITRVRLYADLITKVALLGNTTLYLVPATNEKIQTCTLDGNIFSKLTCIATTVAATASKLAEISATVTATVALGTALSATTPVQLPLCVANKVFSFRQLYIEIPLTIAVCTGKTVVG